MPNFEAQFATIDELNNIVKTILSASNLLGVCTLGTLTFPAIWTKQNQDTQPPRGDRTGLEVILYPPSIDSISFIGSYGYEETWRIQLVQHDRNDSTTPAHKVLLKTFPTIQKKSLLEADTNRAEQLNLTIKIPHHDY
jgi:hypothetical protein